MTEPIKVFISYAHEDEKLRVELGHHLRILERQGVIELWCDRCISPGMDWAGAIEHQLEQAQIILFLISANFLASDYCSEIEGQQALARHEAGKACVMPIILKPVLWQGTLFTKFQVLPKDGKPVTRWTDPNEAFVNIAEGIQIAAEQILQVPTGQSPPELGDLGGQCRVSEPLQSSSHPHAPNPFGDRGRITDPTRFFDREELLRQIFEELSKGVSLSLVGESQVGKSSILEQICTQGPKRLQTATGMERTFAYLSLQWVDHEQDFYDALCHALEIEICRGYKLKRALGNRRFVLCLDEIERMTWDEFTKNLRGYLRGLADGKDAPLTLVIASRSPLTHLFPDSPDLDSPLVGICRQLDVGGFDEGVVRSFLAHRLQGTGVAFTQKDIMQLWVESQGHPAKLQQLAADLYRRFTTFGV